MNKCWICFLEIENNKTILLPDKDDYTGYTIYLPKKCYEIKLVGPHSFLYYNTCLNCLDNYLKIQGNMIKILRRRELGIRN
ncbi:hypothetical protein CPAV1605_132 [seawater metagenome]|uniref:Uncharacterized protein n=1 Tax=seawater metagenome TaxID=1561972 RepID=A0A5E8CLS0_9ZZZZ